MEKVRKIICGGLLVFIFIRPLIDGLTYPFINSLFQFGIILLFLFYLITLLLRKWERTPIPIINRTPLDLPLLFLLFSILLSTFFSVDHYKSTKLLMQYLNYFFLFYLTINIVKKEEVRPFLLAILFTSFIIAVYGIYQYYYGFEQTKIYLEEKGILETLHPNILSRLQGNRAFSFFVYPNILAGYLVGVFPLAIGLSLKAKRKEKPFFILLLFLLLFCLLLTKSTGGFLSLLITSSLLLVFYFLKKKKALLVSSLLLFLFLFLFLFAYNKGVIPHQSSFRDRISYWSAATNIFKERPLAGQGLGSFGIRYSQFKSEEAMETQHAHSLFFETLSEQGLIGIFAFFFFFLSFFIFGYRKIFNRGISFFLFFSFFAFFLHNLVDFDFTDSSLTTIFIFLAGLIFVLKEKNVSTKSPIKNRLTKALISLIIISVLFVGYRLGKITLSERLIQKGRIMAGKGYFYSSRDLLKRGLSLEPSSPDGHFQLSYVHNLLFEREKSSYFLDQAIREGKMASLKSPYLPFYHYHLSLLYAKKGWKEEAKDEMKRALSLYPHKKLYKED